MRWLSYSIQDNWAKHGVCGGVEAAVHVARKFLQNLADEHAIAKLDFKNPFNSVHRNRMLKAAHHLQLLGRPHHHVHQGYAAG